MLRANLGAILAVGLTIVVVVTLGVLNFGPERVVEGNTIVTEQPLAAEGNSPSSDAAAVQAAFEARETLILSQIDEVQTELAARQAEYDLHVEELMAEIAESEQLVLQLHDQEEAGQTQLEELQLTLTQREASYELQSGQAYQQYNANVQQLETQLGEATAKLNEALARLGQ